MSFLYKKIVYLSYRKEDGTVCQSGFVRMRQEGDRYRMEIQVSGAGEWEGRYPVWLEQEQGEYREIGILWLKKGAGRGEAEYPMAETGWEGQSLRIWIPFSDAEGISGLLGEQRGRAMPEASLKSEAKSSVYKEIKSFVSKSSVSGKAATPVSGVPVDQKAGMSVEELLVPREAGMSAEELSVPREAGMSAEELSVPRGAGMSAKELSVPREAGMSAEELSVPRGAGMSVEERSVPREAASPVPGFPAYGTAVSSVAESSVPEHLERYGGVQSEAEYVTERDRENPERKQGRVNRFSLRNLGKMERRHREPKLVYPMDPGSRDREQGEAEDHVHKEKGGQCQKIEPERLSGKEIRKIKQEQSSVREVILNDKWEQLCRIYTRLHPYEDERVYISIQPRDFVILTGNYQYLANNSFLLHGYYNYQYLILGRERQDHGRMEDQEEVGEEEGDCFYLGVPGVYYEREKAVARMFGFEAFECAGGCPATGKFGYYLKRVSI